MTDELAIKPGGPAEYGVPQPELPIEKIEPSRLLANEVRDQLHASGLDDTQIDLAHTRPLGERVVATLQASASPTERVLPSRSLGANLQYEFAPAWLLHGGLRHTRYPSTEVNRLNLMLERYVGNFSASLAWATPEAFPETRTICSSTEALSAKAESAK